MSEPEIRAYDPLKGDKALDRPSGFYEPARDPISFLMKLLEGVNNPNPAITQSVMFGPRAGDIKAASAPLFNFLDKAKELILARNLRPAMENSYYGVSGAPRQFSAGPTGEPIPFVAGSLGGAPTTVRSPDYLIELHKSRMGPETPIHEGLHVAYGMKRAKQRAAGAPTRTELGPLNEAHASRIVERLVDRGILTLEDVEYYMMAEKTQGRALRHLALYGMAKSARLASQAKKSLISK